MSNSDYKSGKDALETCNAVVCKFSQCRDLEAKVERLAKAAKELLDGLDQDPAAYFADGEMEELRKALEALK